MSKLAIAGLTALFITGISPVYAQGQSTPGQNTTGQNTSGQATTGYGRELPSAADLKAFSDRRIEIVKAALQLTPEQEKYWPPIEQAIRARSEARIARLEKLSSLASNPGQRNIIEL